MRLTKLALRLEAIASRLEAIAISNGLQPRRNNLSSSVPCLQPPQSCSPQDLNCTFRLDLAEPW